MNQRQLSALLVALAVAPASGLAQNLSFVSVIVPQQIQVTLQGPRLPQQASGPVAGTDVLAGLSVSSSVVGVTGSVHGQFTASDQSLHAMLSTFCSRDALPGHSALTGSPSVVINLSVPRAMPVRLDFAGFAISNSGVPAPTSRVDVGNDGIPEFEFRAPGGFCSGSNSHLVVNLPAGIVPIRIDVTGDIPATVVGSHCVSSGATLTVKPAHVEVQLETAFCGAQMEATPMLDGVNLRVYVGPSYSVTPVFLVFGTQPTNVILPFGPNCPLLVDPLVVVSIAPTAYTLLPVVGLGPIDLLVQGVMLQPANPWLSHSGLLTSQRGTLLVR